MYGEACFNLTGICSSSGGPDLGGLQSFWYSLRQCHTASSLPGHCHSLSSVLVQCLWIPSTCPRAGLSTESSVFPELLRGAQFCLVLVSELWFLGQGALFFSGIGTISCGPRILCFTNLCNKWNRWKLWFIKSIRILVYHLTIFLVHITISST